MAAPFPPAEAERETLAETEVDMDVEAEVEPLDEPETAPQPVEAVQPVEMAQPVEADDSTPNLAGHDKIFGHDDVHKIAKHEASLADDLPVVLSELSLSQQHVVLVATPKEGRADQHLADQLMAHIAQSGHTAVVVNAGGADHLPKSLGLTDLCEGEAEFGDIIHGGRDAKLFFVPWGTKDRLRFNAQNFMLLTDALSALYDYVIVECGQLGARSPIVAFADSGAHLLLPSDDINRMQFDKIRADAQSLGLGFCRITNIEDRDTHVA